MQNPPSYLEVMSHQNGEDTPPPSYDEVVRPDSPEPQPPIIGLSADRKLIDPFVAPEQEDMPPPIPAHYLKKQLVSDTDQKITHNRNRQELLLAQDQKQNGLIGDNFMGAHLRGAARLDFFEPQPPILARFHEKQPEPQHVLAKPSATSVEPPAPPLPIRDQDPHPTLIDSKKADMPPERIYSIGSLDNGAKVEEHTLRIIAYNSYSDVERMFFKHFFSEIPPHCHHFLDMSIFTVCIRGFFSIKVALEKYSQRAGEHNIFKLIRYAERRRAPILFIEEDEERSQRGAYCEDDDPVYIIGEQKLHNVEHIKKAVQDIVDAELVRKGILPSKRSLDSLESATDLLLEAIGLAISHTSCAEKTNKLQVYVEAIGRIKLNQRYLTCDQWSAAVDSLKVFFDSAKAVICAHRNVAMSALSFLNFAPPTRSFAISELKFNEAETLLSELRLREDHGHSESLSL